MFTSRTELVEFIEHMRSLGAVRVHAADAFVEFGDAPVEAEQAAVPEMTEEERKQHAIKLLYASSE